MVELIGGLIFVGLLVWALTYDPTSTSWADEMDKDMEEHPEWFDRDGS